MKRVSSFLPEPYQPIKLPKQSQKDHLTDLFVGTQQWLKYYFDLVSLKKIGSTSHYMNAQVKEAMIDRIFNFHLCDPSIKPLAIVDIQLFLKSIGDDLASNLKEIVISQKFEIWNTPTIGLEILQLPTSDIESLVKKCSNLVNLSFFKCCVDKHALQALKPLQHLKNFGFRECLSVDNDGFQTPISLAVFADLPILKEINFEGTAGDNINFTEFDSIFERYLQCKITYSYGACYEGSLKNGLPDGKGILRCSRGDILEGVFKEGHFSHGNVVRLYHNEYDQVVSVYKGEWKGGFSNGKRHGQGKHTYFLKTEEFDKGEYEEDVFKEGYKKSTYENGAIYQGYVKNGHFHGKGILNDYDGSKHEGIFFMSQLETGTITYPNGPVENYSNGERTY